MVTIASVVTGFDVSYGLRITELHNFLRERTTDYSQSVIARLEATQKSSL